MAASFLKHSEDQTVVALTAVLRAVSRAGWEGRSFADWGVIAAPNFFGRMGNAVTIQRFCREGAWGISPHLIPHQSLHAASGTISQALKIYGPNFGVGGGADSSIEAFLLAATLMSEMRVPGIWLVLTGHESELIPSHGEHPAAPTPPCAATAMALTPADEPTDLFALGIGSGILPVRLDDAPEFRLGDLIDELGRPEPRPCRVWRLGNMGWLELDPDGRGTSQ
jgi:hypothetical protein